MDLFGHVSGSSNESPLLGSVLNMWSGYNVLPFSFFPLTHNLVLKTKISSSIY